VWALTLHKLNFEKKKTEKEKGKESLASYMLMPMPMPMLREWEICVACSTLLVT